MNQISPKDIKMINSLPPIAKAGDKISWDTEWFGQTKVKLHRAHGRFAYLGCSFDGKTVYYITDIEQVQEFLNRINIGVWILANAKYDFTQLGKYVSIPERSLLWDTQLIEQIMYSGYYAPSDFGLADLARRYLDIYMSKEIRSEFVDDTMSEMTQEQIEYACVDVVATWRVYQEQRKVIDETDLEIWKEIELPFLWTLLEMGGMKVDRQAWISLYKRNEQDALNVQKKYMSNPEILDTMSLKEVKKKKLLNGINLGSWQQIAKELKRQKIHTKSTNEDDLTPFVGNEFVDDVLEFRGKSKSASTYGNSWIEDKLIEDDDHVYSDFFQIGAATGRLSSSSPNVENIPVRETPDFRKCFVADDGWILVDADWSAQEPRIAAYQSQDEKLIQIFKEKKDVYIESGKLMFGWELTKKDPRRKERMKPTVLGASYGLTEYGMEKKYGVPRKEGKELLDTFFDTFEGMAEYKKEQQSKTTYVTTIYGRKFWLNTYQQNYRNNALNSPTQGSAADAMKLAGIEFMREVKKAKYFGKVQIINYVHDEILLQCKKELLEWTENTLRKVMIEVAENMHEGIPADVEISHGHSWHEAHN